LPAEKANTLSNDWVNFSSRSASGLFSDEIDYRLPSLTTLSQKYGISKDTVVHAIETLEAEGLVRSDQGRGTFVLDR
jgi:GntR family phosphonate transport system transcriptional regulator